MIQRFIFGRKVDVAKLQMEFGRYFETVCLLFDFLFLRLDFVLFCFCFCFCFLSNEYFNT